MNIQKKWIKIAILAVEGILIILLITFGSVSTKRGKEIRTQKEQMEKLIAENDSLVKTITKLGAEDVITVNVAFNLTQKNILSFNQTNCKQIAREVATLTRSELYDSIYVKKTTE